MYGTTTGKVRPRKQKNHIALNPVIIKNRRHPLTGKSGYDVIENFGTLRSTELTPERLKAFWLEVELVLQRLITTGKIYRNDADKIRRNFAKVIPLPVVSTAPVPVVKSTNPTAREKLKERFGI